MLSDKSESKTGYSPFHCANCGKRYEARTYQCERCRGRNTVHLRPVFSPLASHAGRDVERIACSVEPWDRIFGGGIPHPAVILLSGEPGAGKTTHAMRVAAGLSSFRRSAIISLEMSEAALHRIALRVGVHDRDLWVTRMENVDYAFDALRAARTRRPFGAVIIDSLPYVTVRGEKVGEMRALECIADETSVLDVTSFVISHATKAGDVAGPMRLQHEADVVVWVEPTQLTVSKNRHGPSGVFPLV